MRTLRSRSYVKFVFANFRDGISSQSKCGVPFGRKKDEPRERVKVTPW